MNNTNQTAQAEQQPTFNPDFSHRLHCSNHANLKYDATCTDQLRETIDVMVMRSKGVLSMVSMLHLESHISQIDPEEVFWALKSVVMGLNDIYAVVEAHDAAVSHKATVGAEWNKGYSQYCKCLWLCWFFRKTKKSAIKQNNSPASVGLFCAWCFGNDCR